MHDKSYISFLLRVWQPDDAPIGVWRGEIEHIQSGECRSFATLDAALGWLREAIERSHPDRSDPLTPPA